MKLQIGIPDYPFNGPIRSAAIRGRKAGRDLPLRLVSIADMLEQHERLPNIRAFPVVIAYDVEKRRIWLHPLPDGEYELDIVRDESVARAQEAPKKSASK